MIITIILHGSKNFEFFVNLLMATNDLHLPRFRIYHQKVVEFFFIFKKKFFNITSILLPFARFLVVYKFIAYSIKFRTIPQDLDHKYSIQLINDYYHHFHMFSLFKNTIVQKYSF